MNKNPEKEADPLLSEDQEIKRKELKEILGLYLSNLEGFEFVQDVALGFKRDHPDCYDYLLFHDMIEGSRPAYVEKFDMPNREIEHLILDLPKLYKEYLERQKLVA